jgi:LacI family transcriptional regulator
VERSDSKIKELFEDTFPIVTFDRLLPGTPYNSIMIDNIEASRHVISDMIAHGAKRIAFITTNSHLQEMQDRYKGYVKELTEAGIEPDETLTGDIWFQEKEKDTFDVLERIFQQHPDVDGFFFATHVLAVEAFHYFHEQGININIGYQLGSIHSEKSFKAFVPQMRVAYFPIEDICCEAIRIVVECIQSFHKGEHRPPEHLLMDCIYSKV